MIGRVIEEEGQKIVQTLAGATAGTVCKVNYGIDCNYVIPITHNEVGEGYVGVSCVCPGPFYNPFTGTLTACSVEAKSTEAEASEMVMSNSLTGDTVYNLAMWCATSDGCYNSVGFSGGRSITYNPYTATLNACCVNATDLLTATCACVTDTLAVESGSFTSLTVTNKIDGSICLADGTNCYDQYCIESISGSSDRPILITGADDAVQTHAVASIGRSTSCSLTYNPSTGVMKRFGAEMGGYTLTLDGAQGGTRYALIDAGSSSGNIIEGKIYSNAFSLVKYCAADAIHRHSSDNYGQIAVGHIDDTSTCVWVKYSGWIPMELLGQKPIKLVCSTTTAPSGITFKSSNSCASYADCSASAVMATYATCHYRCGCNSATDFDIALLNGYANANTLTYVSSSCRLRYCNTTGSLRITNTSGAIAGTVQATNLCGKLYGGLGNTSYDATATWGNQTGSLFYAFSDCAGGAIQFRCNNPTNGQMSIVIDGTVYTCEGQYRVLNTADLKGCGVCKFSISGNTLIISAR